MNLFENLPANKIVKLKSVVIDNKGVLYYQTDFALIKREKILDMSF